MYKSTKHRRTHTHTHKNKQMQKNPYFISKLNEGNFSIQVSILFVEI